MPDDARVELFAAVLEALRRVPSQESLAAVEAAIAKQAAATEALALEIRVILAQEATHAERQATHAERQAELRRAAAEVRWTAIQRIASVLTPIALALLAARGCVDPATLPPVPAAAEVPADVLDSLPTAADADG